MKTVYQPLDSKEEGKWYKVWSIPEEMDIPLGMITAVPPEELQFPKWNHSLTKWEEDSDSLVDDLKNQVETLQLLVSGLYEGGKA